MRIAAEVKDFDPAGLAPPKELRRFDRNVVLALGAAKEAVADAGLNGFDPYRVGIVFGSAIGGLIGIVQQADTLRDRGPDRISPHFIPSVLVDSASGQLAISLGIKGPNYAPVSACATGSHAVGEGAEIIRRGDADAILAGGTEACIHPADPRRLHRHARARGRGRGPAAGVPALRRDQGRLRHGRGCVRARARGARGGEGSRRDALRGGARVRHFERRVPHGRPRARRDRRRRDDALGPRASGGRPEPGGLHQRPRHVDASGRRGRDEGDQGRLRRARLRARGLVDEVGHGPLLRGCGRDRVPDVRAWP